MRTPEFPDIRDRLAVERTYLANERTLLIGTYRFFAVRYQLAELARRVKGFDPEIRAGASSWSVPPRRLHRYDGA